MSGSGLSGQQYCLKWNNHTNNMVRVFNQLLDDQNFCDVTLAVDGTHLKAHKLVLSACSTYFKELFVSNPCKHPIVILKDMRLEDVKAIINFMYCGEVNVSQNQLAALLKTAEVLRVKGLTEVNDKQTESLTASNTLTNNNKTPNETASPQPQHTNSSANSSACVSRKKRRRRAGGNHATNSMSMSCESDGNSSQSDDSSDEASAKKLKEISPIIDPSARGSGKESHSLLSEFNATKPVTKTPDNQSLNVIQTRRRQTLQNLESDAISRDNDSNEQLIDCGEQHINNGNQIEWPSGGEHSSALVLTPHDIDDESNSEDVFDVKPIISFEDSPNQVALREDSSIMMSSPSSDPNAGPSSAQTGNKRRSSLRSYGFQSLNKFGFTDSRSECPFCNKRIVNLRRHINEVHVGVLFQCQICCRKFKRKDKLNHHLITDHNI